MTTTTESTHPTLPPVLLLAGWHGSGPAHWQSHWARQHGDDLIEQDDWEWPRRGDWMTRLEEAVMVCRDGPVLLAAHSLGCHLVAAWAAHTQRPGAVAAALLVAPPDLQRPELPPQLASWRAAPAGPLPFPSHLVHSENDPYGDPAAFRRMATQWGCQGVTSTGLQGHLNVESNLGAWPEGRKLLQQVAALAR